MTRAFLYLNKFELIMAGGVANILRRLEDRQRISRLFRANGQPFSLKLINVLYADPKLKRALQRLPLVGQVWTLISRRLQHRHVAGADGAPPDAVYAR